MNREPKYKSLYRDKWYFVEELVMYGDGSFGVNKFQGEAFSPDSEHVKCTVQFTGLKDKTGAEIYEGDIFKYTLDDGQDETKYTEEVVFNEGSFDLDNCSLGVFCELGEVIGNIYENPDLLK